MIAFFAEHLYFLSCLYFLVFFALSFFSIRDWNTRKRVLIISIVFAVFNLFIRHMYLVDWWNPVFIWENIPFEDPLFSFVITGFIISLYVFVARYFKQIQTTILTRWYKIFIAVGSIITMFGGFYILHLGSFWATIATMLFVSIFVFPKTPEIVKSVLITAILVTLISVPGYLYGSYLQPGWIEQYWILAGLPAKLVLGIPLGEYIFYFLDTFMTIALYEMLPRKKI